MGAKFVSRDHCSGRPDLYKLCAETICIPIRASCPCQHGVEYRCPDGRCIPKVQICDGIVQCSRGEDEISCQGDETPLPGESGVSVAMVAAIVSVCLSVCAILCFAVCVVMVRRRKNNISRESQSATEPLQGGYITWEAADDLKKSKQPRICHPKYRATSTLNSNKNGGSSKRKYQYDNEYRAMEAKKNRTNKQTAASAKRTRMAIYDLGLHNTESDGEPQAQGIYIFKPRDKDTKESKSGIRRVRTDSQVQVNVNGHKHFSGNISLPVTLNFDLDADKFSDTFEADLLCASTPRQPIRHLVIKQEGGVNDDRQSEKSTNQLSVARTNSGASIHV